MRSNDTVKVNPSTGPRDRLDAEVWMASPPDSEIKVSIHHLVLAEVKGQVARWTATIVPDLGDASRSTVEVVVDAGSIQTGVTERDNHMRSAEFLNIARFPEIHFQSREVRAGDAQRMTITGDLRIRDVTRPVTLSIERQDVRGDEAGGDDPRPLFRGHASIRRGEFGLRWYEESGIDALVAGDVVDIDFTVVPRPVRR